MPIFAVYSEIELSKKPAWLDEFRIRYDRSLPYHVTLKQPCFIEERDEEPIRDAFKWFFEERRGRVHPIELTFTELRMGREEHDSSTTFMIDAEPSLVILELQRGILTALGAYKSYCLAESEMWEKDFKPHLSIACNVPNDRLANAKRDLGTDLRCEGVIREVILAIIPENSPEEASHPQDKTIVSLE